MEDTLLRLIRDDLLGHDGPMDTDADLFELGLDSMAIMQLQLAIEDEFGVTIEPVDLSRDNFRTITHIATLIRSKQ